MACIMLFILSEDPGIFFGDSPCASGPFSGILSKSPNWGSEEYRAFQSSCLWRGDGGIN